jgi:hypothetical protein
MANDPSMPPSEQTPNVPGNLPPEGGPESPTVAPSEPGTGGVVAIPKPVFEAVYSLVVQLASGLYQIKTSTDSQTPAKSLPVSPEAAAPAAPEAAAPAAPEAAGPMQRAPEESDEEFLKGLAEQGNKR